MRRHLVRIGVLSAAIALVACDQGINGFIGIPSLGTAGGSLRITPASTQIAVGQTVDLLTNASLETQNRLQWRSLNPSIATVNNYGRVYGQYPGTATIEVRFVFDTTQRATAVVRVVGIGQ